VDIWIAYSGICAAVIRGGGVIPTAGAFPNLLALVNVGQDCRWDLRNTIVGIRDAIVIGVRNLAFNIRHPRGIAVVALQRCRCSKPSGLDQ
jgi:hypothetical protein